MATRSTIAIRKEDGNIVSIYCHYDGQIEGVGRILFHHYKSKAKINALIELGRISVLGSEIAPKEGIPHTFDNPQENVTLAYHRDRGEKLVIDNGLYSHGEYVYIFEHGEWWVRNTYDKGDFATLKGYVDPFGKHDLDTFREKLDSDIEDIVNTLLVNGEDKTAHYLMDWRVKSEDICSALYALLEDAWYMDDEYDIEIPEVADNNKSHVVIADFKHRKDKEKSGTIAFTFPKDNATEIKITLLKNK